MKPSSEVTAIQKILKTMLEDGFLPENARAKISRLSADTSPDELGMDSLAKLTLFGELRKVFGKDLDPQAVSGARSVGDLCRAVREAKAASRA